MNKKVKLSGGQLAFAEYDERNSELLITFSNHSAIRYSAVPAEVFSRLTRAPNPAAYFEDRIADEYPKRNVRLTNNETARKELDDLFG